MSTPNFSCCVIFESPTRAAPTASTGLRQSQHLMCGKDQMLRLPPSKMDPHNTNGSSPKMSSVKNSNVLSVEGLSSTGLPRLFFISWALAQLLTSISISLSYRRSLWLRPWQNFISWISWAWIFSKSANYACWLILFIQLIYDLPLISIISRNWTFLLNVGFWRL